MKPSILVVACFLIVCFVSVFPAVEAAPTTTIYQINSPGSEIAGSENPLPVAVTVYYNNTVSGYLLLVGILDTAMTPARIVPGVVVSSTDPCVSQSATGALCAITVSKSSGIERIYFQVGGIFGGRRHPGVWELNVTSVLIDHQGNLVAGSVSSRLFKINLTPVALNVDVPSNVAVSVDGVLQPAGPVSIGVALGGHNVTVPQLVNVSQSTRLRFDHWSDGYPSPLRSILVTNPTTLQADYLTQNLLTLIGGQGNATVSSWYDANKNATFSAAQSEPMSGALGVRLLFQGWYENGQLLTNSLAGTISMDKPHTLTALWRVDYSIPAAIMLGIIAVLIIAYLLVQRRNRTTTARRGSKRRRKR
ncbi:MAG TPA: hypothetical protein VEG61_06795 [Candidatus Dormibacteraeota bacterium]|nr:hypothetical protein [Candidatus Dormibacteraeota bacterium]